MNTISLRNAASAVFLCVAEEIAHDLSARLIWAAKEIDQLQDDNLRLSAQVESMTCDDEAVKEMAEALEGLLYRTEGISLQDKWDAGLMALQKYKARINESCIHWEEKQ